ncbi:MAG: nitroreductase family protein [Suipraeoptans sp.]
MNTLDCISSRRSIRKFKPTPINNSIIESIVESASFSPSWKNSQITRYIAISDSNVLNQISENATPDYNSKIIKSAPVLIAVTLIKGRSGFERDGSFSTAKGAGWQMFDAGIATQTFCLAANELGLGTVIMGIFDEDKVSKILNIPDSHELAALVALGEPDTSPEMPKRKTVSELIQFI